MIVIKKGLLIKKNIMSIWRRGTIQKNFENIFSLLMLFL